MKNAYAVKFGARGDAPADLPSDDTNKTYRINNAPASRPAGNRVTPPPPAASKRLRVTLHTNSL